MSLKTRQNGFIDMRRLRPVAAAVALIAFLLAAWYLWIVAQRDRQLRSSADLWIISTRLEKMREEGSLAEEHVRKTVRNYAGGQDAWGRPVRYLWEPGTRSYLLVSTGADGTLDVPSIEEYFDAEPEIIGTDFDRDIVVRDGAMLRDVEH